MYNVSYILGAYSLVTPGAQKLAISTDAGLTWSNLPDVSTLLENNAIAVDPNNSLYAVIAGENGILYSLDQGATWSTSGGTFTAVGYKKITYAGTTIFAVGENLAVSTDSGVTFSDLPDTPTDLYGSTATAYSVFFVNELIGYIGVEDKLYKTVNGGLTWTIANGGSAISSGKIISSIVGDASTVVLTTYDGIYKSTDGGNSFLLVQGILGSILDDSISLFRYSASIYYCIFFADASSGSTDRIYSSLNGGFTWTLNLYGTKQGSGYINSDSVFYTDLRGIMFSPGNNGYETTNGGVSRTNFTDLSFKPFVIGTSSFPTYTLYNCVDPEVTINSTSSDLANYIQPSQVVILDEYPEQCWTVGIGDEAATEFEEVTVNESYDSCELCIPVYYTLTNCETDDIIYAEASDELEENNGLVVNIEDNDGCFTVEKIVGFPSEELVIATITQGKFADCECCLPKPEPVPEQFVRTQNAPVKQYYYIHDSECNIRVNKKFAENYHSFYEELALGVTNKCKTIDLDKLWIQKEVEDYSLINPVDQCIVPEVIEETPLECTIATLATCDIPEDVSATGDFL